MIDTSNQPMSIAIMQDDTVLAETTSEDKRDHSSQLMPYLKKQKLKKMILMGL